MGTMPNQPAPDATQADATTAQAPEKKELSQAEKNQILREAVSYYLRTAFHDEQIRKVCEEYVAGIDKEARAAAASAAPEPSAA